MANNHDQVTRYVKLIQNQGHRLTPARRTILEVLVQSGGHLSADHLADLVRQGEPGIGRMTVYRTLDLLNELGLIRPVYQGTGAAHYILMDNGHHHHLICSNCDQVIEFDDCALEGVAKRLGGRFNFQVHGHLLEFYGLCEACRK
jgi:Fur family transcriptional regulator, ferric uptake regulator